jgi:hypothetical protein
MEGSQRGKGQREREKSIRNRKVGTVVRIETYQLSIEITASAEVSPVKWKQRAGGTDRRRI